VALQDPNILAMAALGTLADAPVNPLQPKLVDAVHLRWAFRPELGFPWSGFYLFRRESGEDKRQCLSAQLRRQANLPQNTSQWSTAIGTIRSDHPLALRDDFPPAGVPEFDLAGRDYLEFLPLRPSHRFYVSIGFRGSERQGKRCLRPGLETRAQVPNPYQRAGFDLRSISDGQQPQPLEIAQVTAGAATLRCLRLNAETDITSAEPFDLARLRLVGGEGVEVVAQGKDGGKALGKLMPAAAGAVQVFQITGTALTHITIRAKRDVALLDLCVEGGRVSSYSEIEITGHWGQADVARNLAAGKPGDVVTLEVNADVMDRIRIRGGPAKLIEICYADIESGAGRGWLPLEKLVQPIALPVRAPAYPASGNRATDEAAALYDALDRISYGNPNIWKPAFKELHEQCLNLVQGGAGIAMADPARAVSFAVTPEAGDTATPPKLRPQHPLQLVLLAAMHAPIAQELGLAWSDRTAQKGISYDYLIVADYAGASKGSVNNVLELVGAGDFSALDGFIVFGKRVEPATPLDPPTDARAYALPGATRPDITSTLVDASCNVGLRWQLPVNATGLLPLSPIQYHFWRTPYGATAPATEADPSSFDVLNRDNPQIVVYSLLSLSGLQRPADWPPFAMYGLDNAVAEGWYGYRLSNVDVFGRHSALSQAARWFQWGPQPSPVPWYYQPPAGDTVINPFAIGLLDKLPPPPPTATEAYALDPADPYVQRDAAYSNWYNALSVAEKPTVIGLRVRWTWTTAHMRQAPDTREFRIYYQGDRLNTLLGKTSAITAASATESFVSTDIANTSVANAFVGCSLKQGPQTFTVLGSDAGTPLRLRVRNLGPSKDITLKSNTPCEVVIADGTDPHVDFTRAQAWDQRWYVVGYNEHVTLGTDAAGNPFRTYEVLLPAQADAFRGGLPLAPDLAEPVRFGAVGVTTCDSRTHSTDDPRWATGRWGGRFGNESPVSPPALVFRVLRTPPAAPVPPLDSEKVFATPADYHALSRYTFRWAPQAFLRTHVYRAMDETVFQVDWSHQPRAALDGTAPVFPSASIEPRWDALKRQQVAQELNGLCTIPKTMAGKAHALALYRALSNDALRVLAGLPGNESAFAQLTKAALDPADPTNANRRGPDNPPGYVVDPTLRAYVDELDGRSTNRYFYRACAVDGAQNRSALSLSGPPVWLPNVVPPRSPVFTKLLAGDAAPNLPGDNKITLRWASNRESDLASYKIYRAASEAATRSLATMTLVHTEAVAAGDPGTRPAENLWTDASAVALEWTYYCITAVDTAGNESPPSPPVKARAYDESLPVVPGLAVVWDGAVANQANATWTATMETRLERRSAAGVFWENVNTFLPPGSHTIHDSVNDAYPWKYRLRARKATGAVAVGPVTNLGRK